MEAFQQVLQSYQLPHWILQTLWDNGYQSVEAIGEQYQRDYNVLRSLIKATAKSKRERISEDLSLTLNLTFEECVRRYELQAWKVKYDVPEPLLLLFLENNFNCVEAIGHAWSQDGEIIPTLVDSSGLIIDIVSRERLALAMEDAATRYLQANSLGHDFRMSVSSDHFTIMDPSEEQNRLTRSASKRLSFDANVKDPSSIASPTPRFLFRSKSTPIAPSGAISRPLSASITPRKRPSTVVSQFNEDFKEWLDKNANGDIIHQLQSMNILTIEQFLAFLDQSKLPAIEDLKPIPAIKFHDAVKALQACHNYTPSTLLSSPSSSPQMSRTSSSVSPDILTTSQMLARPLPQDRNFHAFLAHTWRPDELDRDNHERVSKVNDALIQRGFKTWFDKDKLNGNIRKQMAEGLYGACCLIIFITRAYEMKVNTGKEDDNCAYEFETAMNNDLVNRRIPVVMDPSMVDPSSWQRSATSHRLHSELGKLLCVDLSSDDSDAFEEGINELAVRIENFVQQDEQT